MSWAWWRVTVIPTTQEAEAGESLEPRRQRLQWAKITLLYSSLDERVRLHLKNKQKNPIHTHTHTHTHTHAKFFLKKANCIYEAKMWSTCMSVCVKKKTTMLDWCEQEVTWLLFRMSYICIEGWYITNKHFCSGVLTCDTWIITLRSRLVAYKISFWVKEKHPSLIDRR